MNALDLLKQQHHEADELFEKLSKASMDEKERIFDALADALAIHTAIEEKHFYPAAAIGPEVTELLREAAEEHLGVKRFIADLLELDADDETFEAKVDVLKEQVQHHVKEEENELFPKVQKALDERTLEALGQTMETMMKAMEGTEPRNDIPRQTLAATPVDERKSHAA